MRKRIFGKKLSRSRTAREAMYRALTRSLIEYGKIDTTFAKAKGVQVYIEKLFSKALRGNLNSRRHLRSILANDRRTSDLLFKYAKLSGKKSGFTRAIRISTRRGDAAQMARLELTFKTATEEKKVLSKKAKTSDKDSKRVDKKLKPANKAKK